VAAEISQRSRSVRRALEQDVDVAAHRMAPSRSNVGGSPSSTKPPGRRLVSSRVDPEVAVEDDL